MINQFRDPNFSLWQSAVDETIAEEKDQNMEKSADTWLGAERPDTSDPMVKNFVDYFNAMEGKKSSDEASSADEGIDKGVIFGTLVNCTGLAMKAAKSLVKQYILGQDVDEEQYVAQFTAEFGGCDPRYAKAVIKYAQFLLKKEKIPYRRHESLNDFVIEGKLPDDATVALLADWGTGQKEALNVLRQVKEKNPQVAIHLGDIYYSGTEFEVDNYFFRPWRDILRIDENAISTYNLTGNHDMYAGGKPYYDLIDKLGQPASYFCLRNEHWQFLAIDTGLNARLGSNPTYLEDSEAEWLIDKIENSGGRRTVLLSHHQLFSASEQFEGQSFNVKLYKQLVSVIPQIDIWFWGHEHNLVVFDNYLNLKRGRCIGYGAFPVGASEQIENLNPDVPMKIVTIKTNNGFYEHGYAIMKLEGDKATVSYFQDSDPVNLVFKEEI